ncbi:MAG: cobalamin ABC transporter ATP-binding protein [Moraxellaceae bacterium]|nr:MAG: cobalamin ABC transporter ATP-binding protein [Moraxellaceae bacterium]
MITESSPKFSSSVSATASTTLSLECRDVGFHYDQDDVLKNVHFQAHQGQMIALVGPNGAGKSTLLQLLIRALKPSSGAIALNNTPLTEFSRKALAQQMAFVPQDTQIGYSFSVQEIVAMGRHPYLGRFQAMTGQDYQAIDAAMSQTELTHLSHRAVNELSGGERQRTIIARALAQQAKILILDEATANLDLCHQLELLTLCRQLADAGHLIITAIHDLNNAARFCDRVLLLNQSRLVADGSPEQVFTEANLATHFHLQTKICPAEHYSGLSISPVKALT